MVDIVLAVFIDTKMSEYILINVSSCTVKPITVWYNWWWRRKHQGTWRARSRHGTSLWRLWSLYHNVTMWVHTIYKYENLIILFLCYCYHHCEPPELGGNFIVSYSNNAYHVSNYKNFCKPRLYLFLCSKYWGCTNTCVYSYIAT